MTTQLPFILTEKQITVILPNGNPKSVNKTSINFEKIITALKAKDFDAVIKLIDLESSIKEFFTSHGVEVKSGIIFVDGEELPKVLSDKVSFFINENLPYEPLINFWNNLKKNPSGNSVQELYGCLEHNHHPITPDGCFIAYKAVDSNYLDKHTHTMSNKIGETVTMPRNKVNDDKYVTCSWGLHVASFNYARDFMTSFGDHLMTVKVNPEHVVSVPVDYNDQKMRVCQYTIIGELPNDKLEPIKDQLWNDEDESEDCGCDCQDCCYDDHCGYCEDEEEDDEECDCVQCSCMDTDECFDCDDCCDHD
jgi:hypothetical protein